MHLKDQLQAIIDKMVGVPPDTLPNPMELDQPWRSIFCQVHRVGDFAAADILLYDVTRPFGNRKELFDEIHDLLPPGDAFTAYPSLWEMSGELARVDWLWPSWLPRGLVTLFGAAPGARRSLSRHNAHKPSYPI